MYKRFKFILL